MPTPALTNARTTDEIKLDRTGTSFNSRAATAHSRVRIGRSSSRAMARRLPLSQRQPKRGDDMKSTRLLIAGAAVALMPFAGAFAQSQDPATQPSQQPAQQPAQQGATFESLDADSDGKISKAEAAANETVSAQFSKYDQNGDGFIERSEVNSANDSRSQPNPQ
jgi:hypothetical protein